MAEAFWKTLQHPLFVGVSWFAVFLMFISIVTPNQRSYENPMVPQLVQGPLICTWEKRYLPGGFEEKVYTCREP